MDYPNLSIVVPVFNEEEVIEAFFARVTGLLKQNNIRCELIFVDDGSVDRTYELLCQCKEKSPGAVKVIRLARNFGHQLAITAGLRAARGAAVVVTDGDLRIRRR